MIESYKELEAGDVVLCKGSLYPGYDCWEGPHVVLVLDTNVGTETYPLVRCMVRGLIFQVGMSFWWGSELLSRATGS